MTREGSGQDDKGKKRRDDKEEKRRMKGRRAVTG
jgi:hypothetical protein